MKKKVFARFNRIDVRVNFVLCRRIKWCLARDFPQENISSCRQPLPRTPFPPRLSILYIQNVDIIIRRRKFSCSIQTPPPAYCRSVKVYQTYFSSSAICRRTAKSVRQRNIPFAVSVITSYKLFFAAFMSCYNLFCSFMIDYAHFALYTLLVPAKNMCRCKEGAKCFRKNG